jgi:hypothetical protein
MSAKSFNGDQKSNSHKSSTRACRSCTKLKRLQGGLNDTIKAIAEELEVKPTILKKAIKLAHKAEFGKEKQDHETLETILETVGKTL